MNSTDTANVLEGQDAMDLYEQGRDAWNKWAKAHDGWTVDFSSVEFIDEIIISFSNFLFPGSTLFKNATFTSPVISFEGAIFRGKVTSFEEAEFNSQDISFYKTFFLSKKLIFSKSKFEGNTLFEYARFYNHTIAFTYTKFNGEQVLFPRARFRAHNIFFMYTKFPRELVLFTNCMLHVKSAHFASASCKGDLYLSDTSFVKSDSISFNRLRIGGGLILNNTSFSVVPDFRNLNIIQPPSMDNMAIEHRKHPSSKFKKRVLGPQHSGMYRKLKTMAIESKDHDREIEFFAMEERAKRGWHKTWFQYLPTLLYDKVSNFGRSIFRPFICLIIVWLCSAVAFLCALTNTWTWNFFQIKNSLLLSASHLLPFFPWSRENRDRLIKTISDTDINEDTVIASAEVITYLEGFFVLIFVSLIGLALRNRFRIGHTSWI